MCGIVGFTGKHQAAPILLDAFRNLNTEDMIPPVSQCVTVIKKQKSLRQKVALKF